MAEYKIVNYDGHAFKPGAVADDATVMANFRARQSNSRAARARHEPNRYVPVLSNLRSDKGARAMAKKQSIKQRGVEYLWKCKVAGRGGFVTFLEFLPILNKKCENLVHMLALLKPDGAPQFTAKHLVNSKGPRQDGHKAWLKSDKVIAYRNEHYAKVAHAKFLANVARQDALQLQDALFCIELAEAKHTRALREQLRDDAKLAQGLQFNLAREELAEARSRSFDTSKGLSGIASALANNQHGFDFHGAQSVAIHELERSHAYLQSMIPYLESHNYSCHAGRLGGPRASFPAAMVFKLRMHKLKQAAGWIQATVTKGVTKKKRFGELLRVALHTLREAYRANRTLHVDKVVDYASEGEAQADDGLQFEKPRGRGTK